jgi:hypothetical protein
MWRTWLFFRRTGMTVMVTSATNKLSLDHDYLIREWEAAALDKPSITSLDRIAEIPPGYLGTAGRIGRLAEVDIEAIKAIPSETSDSQRVSGLGDCFATAKVRPRRPLILVAV